VKRHLLEKPDQQQDDDDERDETATDVHSGLLLSDCITSTAQATGELRAGAGIPVGARYPLGMTLLRPRVNELLPVLAVAPRPQFVHVPA
jgi:hypothetical protein